VAVAIEMWFSEDGDQRVRTIWSALEARGVASLASATHARHVPHVSLTVMDQLRPAANLADLVTPVLGMTLRLSAVGGFPGVASLLLPAFHEPLTVAHRKLHEALVSDGAPVWEHYLPGSWVPHCIMTFWQDAADMTHLAAMVDRQLPIDVSVAAVNAVDTKTGDVVRRLAAGPG
jgi:hypothetical protein